MAESIVALGLAANVVQFIEFGSRLAAQFWSFYRSGSSGAHFHPDLDQINIDLQRVLTGLQVPPNQTDSGVVQLVQDCHRISVELDAILRSLSEVKISSARDALKAAFKAVWKEDEIKAFQDRLDRFRAQLNLHLLTIIRKQTQNTVEQQNEIIAQMKAVSEGTERLEERLAALHIDEDGFGPFLLEFVTAKIAEMSARKEIQDALREEIVSEIYRHHHNKESGSLGKPAPLVSEARIALLQTRFLSHLRYRGMGDREGRIEAAYESTFEWIFEKCSHKEQSWSNFSEWLESDSQLYWITGKAGSGKSTLMKFIVQEEQGSSGSQAALHMSSRCMPFLRKWAGDSTLLTVSYFFWNSGVQLQMKHEGLLRSLLAQILEKAPEILPIVCPAEWEALCFFEEKLPSWSDHELQRMLLLATSCLPNHIRACFFIDGLDEFEGDHNKLARLLKDIIISPQIKLCVSSRPWTEFEDAFRATPSLMLQDLTYTDIKHYVSSHFADNPGFALLRQREHTYADNLVENVVKKACGVFLWVHLVVNSLLSGMAYGDRIIDLQRRLDLLPPELEQLYDKILLSLDPFYLEHASQLFKVIQASKSPPELLTLAFADEDKSWKSVIKRPMQQIKEREIKVLQETMRRRINSRCKGFLEAKAVINITESSRNEDAKITVEYLHRTVKDYIESPEVQQKLDAPLKGHFDPHFFLCTGILAMLKFMPSSMWRSFSLIDWFMYHAARVSQQSEAQLIEVMDDLGNFCTFFMNVGSSLVYRANSSPETIRCKLFPISPLGLAVRYAVLGYVRARAPDKCLVNLYQDNTINADYSLYPMLLGALALDPDNHSFMPHATPRDPAIIMWLLQNGADPNYVEVGSSIWDLFLGFHAALPAASIETLLMMKLLLDFGAGTYSEGIRKFHQSRVESSIENFEELQPAEYYRLISDLRTSSYSEPEPELAPERAQYSPCKPVSPVRVWLSRSWFCRMMKGHDLGVPKFVKGKK